MSTKKNATTRLKQITTRAKAIRKKHPAMKWISAVREASRQIMSGKKKAPASPSKKRKVRSHKPTAKRPARHGRPARKHSSKITASGHLARAKKILEVNLGAAEVRKFKATTARVRRKAAKYIAALKKRYKKIS
jgi:hypothetical protein